MAVDVNLLNSLEAAKILGVNVSSIKRWTDEGKLECIRTAGGHRKFLMDHLSAFLKMNQKKTSKLSLFTLDNAEDLALNYYILKGDFDYLKNYIFKQALKSNRVNVQKVLTGLYLGQYPLFQIYDNLVTPALHHIGLMWTKKKISIFEEHIASQIIRDAIIRLQGIIKIPAKAIKQVICLNLSSELHDIALKMVQNILEVRGFKTFFSGQKTPFFDFEHALTRFKPSRIYLASTINENPEEAQKEVDLIFKLSAKKNIQVFVGGSGFDQINYKHPIVVRRLYTFQEVNKY